MRWKSLLLPAFLVVIFGGLVGFFANVYFQQHPILITKGEDVYNILRDVIIIVIAVLTILTAVLITIVGWALRGILLRDLRTELSSLVQECKDELFSNLSTKVGFLWGRHFELDKMKDERFINFAIDEGERAVDHANKLNEEKYWELRVRAINNYLMALAEKGDEGDANQAYKLSTELERLLKKYEQELGLPTKQRWEETIYFVRYRLPRAKSNDREEAKQNFYCLKEHPKFKEWEKRWKDFNLLP